MISQKLSLILGHFKGAFLPEIQFLAKQSTCACVSYNPERYATMD